MKSRHRLLPLALLLLLPPAAGCAREAEEKRAGNEAPAAAPAAAPADAATANAAAPGPAPAPAGAGCAGMLPVELDRETFVHSDIPAFTAERLEAFPQAAAAGFREAAQAGCAVGEVSPERLAALDRLLIRSASGATETHFYEPDESPGTLVFEYIFAEADLALPETDDIRLGLACWIDPENEECAGREP